MNTTDNILSVLKGTLLITFILLIIVIVISCAAYERNAIWKDAITLWTGVIGKYQDSAVGIKRAEVLALCLQVK